MWTVKYINQVTETMSYEYVYMYVNVINKKSKDTHAKIHSHTLFPAGTSVMNNNHRPTNTTWQNTHSGPLPAATSVMYNDHHPLNKHLLWIFYKTWIYRTTGAQNRDE